MGILQDDEVTLKGYVKEVRISGKIKSKRSYKTGENNDKCSRKSVETEI